MPATFDSFSSRTSRRLSLSRKNASYKCVNAWKKSPGRKKIMKRILWILFYILGATTICTAQSVLYFPQIVEGQGGGSVWGSAIILTNTAAQGTAVASGTLILTKDDGTLWSLPLMDLQGNSLR